MGIRLGYCMINRGLSLEVVALACLHKPKMTAFVKNVVLVVASEDQLLAPEHREPLQISDASLVIRAGGRAARERSPCHLSLSVPPCGPHTAYHPTIVLALFA